MGRWRNILLAMVLGTVLAGSASAADPYYLNGDKTLPMIQSTGRIRKDRADGLFINLSTVEIENVFEDGLACQVKSFQVVKGKEAGEAVMHVRFSEGGKAWAEAQDGSWREIPENSSDPASLAVGFIRQALGDETLRPALVEKIDTIAAAKKGNLGKVEPEGALPLAQAVPAKAASTKQAAKQKGSVQKAETKAKPAAEKKTDKAKAARKKDEEPVVVTITEAPKVEITTNPPVQVDIT